MSKTDETREALKIAISDAILGWDPTHGSLRQVKDALAAHDRETARKAWDEGFDAGERDAMDPRIDTHTCTPNPYSGGGEA